MLQPRLRFGEFGEEWENKPFKDIVQRATKHSNENNLPRITFDNINAGMGTLNNVKQSTDEGIEFHKNDVLFGKLRPYLNNLWLAKFNGIAVGDFWVLNSPNGNFTYNLVQTERYRYISNITSGTKMPRSDWNLVSNHFFKVPNLTEQQKIGTFFNHLDHLIHLQQAKLDHLKQLKTGYLHKMFPNGDSKMPAMRFKGFDNDWEKTKLGNISNWSRGTDISKDKLNTDKNGIPVVHYADLYKFNNVQNSVIHWSVFKEGTEIKPNSLLFPMSDVTPNGLATTTALNIKNVKAGSDVLIATIADSYNSKFLSFQLNNNKEKILRIVVGTTVRHIHSDDLSNISINITNKLEQNKISNFFQNMEEQINLASNKLNNLTQTKTAYLQKIFI